MPVQTLCVINKDISIDIMSLFLCPSNLQRVKNPPIRLKEFASVDSMREEINEVVAFLQNPKAFQEMGARAPRV